MSWSFRKQMFVIVNKSLLLAVAIGGQTAWAGFFNANSEINFNAIHGYAPPRLCYQTAKEACVSAPHAEIGKRYYYSDNPPPNQLNCGNQDIATGNASFPLVGNSYVNSCQVKEYYLPDSPPNTECGVGNPIFPSFGVKYQKVNDLDLPIVGYTWSRFYLSRSATWGYFLGSVWRHSFETYIDDIRPEGSKAHFSRENLYSTPQSVCNDWINRRSTYMNGIFVGTNATLKNDRVCEISIADSIIAQLPIQKVSGSRVGSGVDPEALTKTISRPNGNTYIFEKRGQAFEEVNGNDVYLDFINDQFVFTDKNGIKDTFENGLLFSRKLPTGQVIEVIRDTQERIEKLNFGTKTLLTITYNADGLIESVNNGSVTVRYSYDVFKNLSTAVVSGEVVRYHYEDADFPHHLTGLTDQSGVRFVTWAYDDEGRAIRSERAGGKEKYLIDYSNIDDTINPRVRVTNPLNKDTTYYYEVIGGQRRVVRMEGHESAYCIATDRYTTYYPNGSLQTKTNARGSVTYYERDQFNRVTLKAEGYYWSDNIPRFGELSDPLPLLTASQNFRTTRTCWDAIHAKRKKLIEEGRVTIYEYFGNGNLKLTKSESVDNSNQSCP